MTEQAVPVVAVGICGSDIQRFRSGFALTSLGHELVGQHPDDGGLVAIRPLRPCRRCPMCRRGWTEQRADDASIGHHDTRRGGFSGSVQATTDQLYRLPANVDIALATLTDPLACVVHATRSIEMAGLDVLVIGDGPMAALAAVRARQQNAWRVTVAVKSAERIERLSTFADSVVTAGSVESNRYDVVVEAVGGISSEPISIAAAAVAPLGQVVALGVYRPQATADLSVRCLLEKESILRGSKAYRVNEDQDDFAAALEILSNQPADFAPIIATCCALPSDIPQSFANDRPHTLKVVYTLRKRPHRLRTGLDL